MGLLLVNFVHLTLLGFTFPRKMTFLFTFQAILVPSSAFFFADLLIRFLTMTSQTTIHAFVFDLLVTLTRLAIFSLLILCHFTNLCSSTPCELCYILPS